MLNSAQTAHRAKNVMFWVCFTATGIVDVVTSPPGEMFDRCFLVDIALDGLKKKLPKFPIRIQKRITFCIWIVLDPI
jgi:hypothetical protein